MLTFWFEVCTIYLVVQGISVGSALLLLNEVKTMSSRYAIAAVVGTAITISLVWLMQFLIQVSEAVETDAPRLPPITLGTVTPDTEVNKRSTTMVVSRPPVTPLVLPRTTTESTPTGIGTPLVAQAPPMFDATGTGFRLIDSGLINVVTAQPDYPHIAASRGLEGEVIVAFDVNEAGGVENVTVISSSHKVFEKAAIGAAYKSRYKAKTVDGVPQSTYGLRKLFRFKLEN